MIDTISTVFGFGAQPQAKADKLPQYIAGLSASLGAFAMGAVLGWSSPVGLKFENDKAYEFEVSDAEMPYVGSLVPLGAAISCYPTGLVMDAIGRRRTMLFLVIPFVVGWILILVAQNVGMLMAGRFITGFSGGAFCVTAPTYNSEITIDSIRGTLGSFFQLQITIGILFAYAVGSYSPLCVFNGLCLMCPVFFCFIFFFMPESPKFLVCKGKDDKARKALIRLRGKNYDVDTELATIKQKHEERVSNKGSLWKVMQKKPAGKAVFICYAMMLFQQLSGINAVIFNTSTIFADAGATIEPAVCSIIIGVIQVIATLTSSLVVDRLGRTILLLLSSLVMSLCSLALGVFFFLKDGDKDVSGIGWLPLLSLSLFIIAFSLGFGPIPWMMAGEMCLMDIQSFVFSTGGTFNWLLAFLVTCTFAPLEDAIGTGEVLWVFSVISGIGFLFILFIVPETKGKSVDEVQKLLLSRKKFATSTRSTNK